MQYLTFCEGVARMQKLEDLGIVLDHESIFNSPNLMKGIMKALHM
jgi:hypothetical protein